MAATVRCPICGKSVPFNDPNMPFCSDRCRVLDLGHWASDEYVIPASDSPTDIQDIDIEMADDPKDPPH